MMFDGTIGNGWESVGTNDCRNQSQKDVFPRHANAPSTETDRLCTLGAQINKDLTVPLYGSYLAVTYSR
jgi:hypothetical protein